MDNNTIKDLLRSVVPVLSTQETQSLDPVMDPESINGCVAVAPSSVAEIRDLVKLCNENKLPIIPHGGRTGLAGGLSADGSQVMVLGTKLPRILEIDPVSQTALFSANITLADAEQAARAHNLTLGIDLAARDSATIGGMIATNAGGMEAHRNGTMRHRVLGLQAVLADGTVLQDLAHVRKCNEGYDIKQLIIGSEGTLGVITAATVQLLPAPPDGHSFLLALDNAKTALEILSLLQAHDHISLLRAEAMWGPYAQANGPYQKTNPIAEIGDAPLYVIYEVHTPDDDVEALVFESVEPFLETGKVANILSAQSLSQTQSIWSVREDTLSLGSIYPHQKWFDISVPLRHLDAHVQRVEDRIAALQAGLKIHVLGHLADGNLHYTIISDTEMDDALSDQINAAVLDGLKQIGGSFSAEHGIGTDKRDALARYGDLGKLHLMKAVKQSLDPNNIFNPGKIF